MIVCVTSTFKYSQFFVCSLILFVYMYIGYVLIQLGSSATDSCLFSFFSETNSNNKG